MSKFVPHSRFYIKRANSSKKRVGESTPQAGREFDFPFLIKGLAQLLRSKSYRRLASRFIPSVKKMQKLIDSRVSRRLYEHIQKRQSCRGFLSFVRKSVMKSYQTSSKTGHVHW